MNSPAPGKGRGLFAKIALDEIPKLLTLQDRNRHSPTYGCFDRNYWHYKVIDFPSGMSQEFVWPLALATVIDLDGNPWFQNESIREYVRAGILFAARSRHADGACDDYFPNEQALGATAFSLLACAEACSIIGFQADEALQFIRRSARWLANRNEHGRLTNHHALVALGLDIAGQLLKTNEFAGPRDASLSHVLSWQNREGWFPEYDGFDPGYDTLTLSCLARLQLSNPSQRLADAISSSVRLLANFIHPDGSFGGEYGSRNTSNYFPHGFELAGQWLPEALSVNDRFLAGLARQRGACYSDDRIIGHHAWNYLLAARDFVADRPQSSTAPNGRVELKEGGMVVDRRPTRHLFLSLTKGGTLKLFSSEQLLLSDTGVSIRLGNGRVAVTHLAGDYERIVEADRIVVRGRMGWARHEQMTPLRLLLLRTINLTIGKVAPDFVRSLLQKRLITGKEHAPFQFERTLEWTGDQWKITDRIQADSWHDIESAGIASDETSIYVAMSRTFQPGQLQPWLDLTPQVRALRDGEPLIVERTL